MKSTNDVKFIDYAFICVHVQVDAILFLTLLTKQDHSLTKKASNVQTWKHEKTQHALKSGRIISLLIVATSIWKKTRDVHCQLYFIWHTCTSPFRLID